MNPTLKKVLIGLAVIFVAAIAFLVGRGAGGGAIEHSVQFSITVNVSGDFAIDITPKDVLCTKGETLTFNITATPSNGFDADIQLSVGGLPAGSYTLAREVLSPGQYGSVLTVNTALLESNSVYTCTLNAHDL